MIGNVRLVGQCLTCTMCGAKRSLAPDQFPEDSVLFGYTYVSRREAWERQHAHGAQLPRLPRAPQFEKRRLA